MAGPTEPSGGWSEPRIVDKGAPPPLVLGEMADVRRQWRQERVQRYGRRVWPLFTLALFVIVAVCTGLLVFGPVLRF